LPEEEESNVAVRERPQRVRPSHRRDNDASMTRRQIEEGIHTELQGSTTYADYLRLDQLLSAQTPRSTPPHHDEVLFIIQHQTSELWMKLMIHELEAALGFIRADQLDKSFKIFARVGQIQRVLFEQWSVLETLTPNEYLEFRDALGRASGFQSHQYRALEFLFGNKEPTALLPFRHQPPLHGELERILQMPSIYDEFLRHLKRAGHLVPADKVERDWTQPYERSEAVMEVFRRIYQHTDQFWSEYEMCEKLVDVEERFQLWRFRHLKTVQRIIGFKRGTGGSSGVAFLSKALDLTFFPELWDVRTELKPNPPAGAQ
jgi:tryptophan 2,3-dioxygenase